MADNDAIPTYCHLVPGWDTAKCCSSCHWDADDGYEPCEVEVKGKTMTVCCAVAVWWREDKVEYAKD